MNKDNVPRTTNSGEQYHTKNSRTNASIRMERHKFVRILRLVTAMSMAPPANHPDEYSNLVRINRCHQSGGFTWVPNTTPATYQELCRTLTFARGRILYEIWNDYHQETTGLLVPSLVSAIAWRHHDSLSADRWNGLPLHERNRHRHAYALLMQRFPRMPLIAAIRVSERAVREAWNGDSKKLEERVVNHVRHEWTSYETRLELFERPSQPLNGRTASTGVKLLKKKEEVLEAVKPHLREVLLSWLPSEISSSEVAKFWGRHHLYDLPDGNTVYRQEKVTIRRTDLQDCGGLETPANLLSKTELIM